MENIQEFRLFVHVARCGSLSAAGKFLGLSSPSVSRIMNKLEAQVGARLLNRSSRTLSLTQAGEIFLERISAILRDIDQLKSTVSELANDTRGRLHVHMSIAHGTHLVIPAIADFRRLYPDIDLDLTLSDEPVDLIKQSIDVSITGKLPHATSPIVRKLDSCSRIVCASPSYFLHSGTPTRVEELSTHNCLTYRFSMGNRLWRLRSGKIVETVSPRSVVQTNNGVTLRDLALKGLGIVMLPEWLVAEDIRQGRLVQLFEGYDAAPTATARFISTAYLVYLKTPTPSPKLRVFVDLLVNSIHRRRREGRIRMISCGANIPDRIYENDDVVPAETQNMNT